jgi:hypothetical protein
MTLTPCQVSFEGIRGVGSDELHKQNLSLQRPHRHAKRPHFARHRKASQKKTPEEQHHKDSITAITRTASQE